MKLGYRLPNFLLLLSVLGYLGLFAVAQEAPVTLALSLSKSEAYVAISSSDGSVTVEEVSTSAPLVRLIGHTEPAISVWGDTDDQLVTISTDLTARVWDLTTGEQTHMLRRDDWVVGAVWLSETQIYISDNSVSGVIWDLSSNELQDAAYGGWAFSFSPDRQYLAAARPSGTAILDTVTLKEITVYLEYYGEEASLGDVEDDERTLLPVTTIEWQPNGELVASGNTLGKVTLRNVLTGEVIHEFSASDLPPLTATSHFVKDLAFSIDGSQINSIAEDGTVRTWNVLSGELIEERTTERMMSSAVFTQSLDRLIYIEYHVVEVDEEFERNYDATGISQLSLTE